jgi:hypothetical protein
VWSTTDHQDLQNDLNPDCLIQSLPLSQILRQPTIVCIQSAFGKTLPNSPPSPKNCAAKIPPVQFSGKRKAVQKKNRSVNAVTQIVSCTPLPNVPSNNTNETTIKRINQHKSGSRADWLKNVRDSRFRSDRVVRPCGS